MNRASHRSFREQRLRLRGFDYSTPCWYFVTLVTHMRRCTLGTIVDGAPCLSTLGRLVEARWQAIPAHVGGLVLGAFVVMPNHLHGLLRLVAGEGGASLPLSTIISGFKASVSRAVGPAAQPVWQPRFHDRIVRSEAELGDIERYILDNPRRWALDRENPASEVPFEGRDPDWPVARARLPRRDGERGSTR